MEDNFLEDKFLAYLDGIISGENFRWITDNERFPDIQTVTGFAKRVRDEYLKNKSIISTDDKLECVQTIIEQQQKLMQDNVTFMEIQAKIGSELFSKFLKKIQS